MKPTKITETFIREHSKENIAKLSSFETEFKPTLKVLGESCNFTNTTSLTDIKMLVLLNLIFKPKIILEIGTFVGSTAYSLAESSIEGATVYTVDYGDKFVKLNIPCYKKIRSISNTGSTDFLKKSTIFGIDMAFVDANITSTDIDLLYPKLSDNFIFAVHDYYDSEGNPQKGFEAIKLLIDHLVKLGNYNFTTLLPEKNWYFTGFPESGVNGCVATVIAKK